MVMSRSLESDRGGPSLEIVHSKRCLEYSYAGHPENPSRVSKAGEILKELGYRFVEPKPASDEDLLRAHTKDWIERVRRGGSFDADTPGSADIYEYARLSAGRALVAANAGGLSLLRPPGHHAGKAGRALCAATLGFCYFNNIAIAVRHLDEPTLILDIDGHHGNGTQEIFLGDSKVTYVSLHRIPHYPGTGLVSDKNCLNFPLSFDAGDEQYLKSLDTALRQVNMKRVEVIAISAGFDAHRGDLASLGLTSDCYREIGKRLRSLGKRVFGVLEGGYSGENIARDLNELIGGLEGRERSERSV
jgi:acetoin utilization deacetylase AcuC-like enzyme